MALGNGILSGKKTYIVAGLGALGYVAAYLTGDMSLVDAIQGMFTAILGATIRAGVTSEVKKVGE